MQSLVIAEKKSDKSHKTKQCVKRKTQRKSMSKVNKPKEKYEEFYLLLVN